MIIGIPTEVKKDENSVAMTPDVVGASATRVGASPISRRACPGLGPRVTMRVFPRAATKVSGETSKNAASLAIWKSCTLSGRTVPVSNFFQTSGPRRRHAAACTRVSPRLFRNSSGQGTSARTQGAGSSVAT